MNNVLTPFQSEFLNKVPCVRHGFFTRRGGVSGGGYATLNCKLLGDDNPQHVLENRRRIISYLGAQTWVSLKQEHTDRVHHITHDFDTSVAAIQVGDALITRERGLALAILTADCVPILMSDKAGTVVGAIHAGWMGLFSGVIHATIQNLCDLGYNVRDLIVCVGPCIHAHSYEVGPEFYDHILKFNQAFAHTPLDPGHVLLPSPHREPHFLFDLPKSVFQILSALGIVHSEHIAQNTYTQDDLFFSYRRCTHTRVPHTGCHASVIALS